MRYGVLIAAIIMVIGLSFYVAGYDFGDDQTPVPSNPIVKKTLLNKDAPVASKNVPRPPPSRKLTEKEKYDLKKRKDISDNAVKSTDLKQNTLSKTPKKDNFLSVSKYKSLDLYNVNTREKLDVIFWVNGKFVPEALEELNWFMRDWRRDVATEIDPELFMLIYKVNEEVDGDGPIHLISGHRSKKTNEAMRAKGGGQAKKSQHILGKAADISIPNVPVSVVRKTALELEEGGVGYYPKSGFVHVDTGRVRQW